MAVFRSARQSGSVWDTSVLCQSFLSCCCWLSSGPGRRSLFLLFPLLGPVIVRGTIVIKPHDQVNLGNKGFVWLTLYITVHHRRKLAGTWRQELMMQWRGAAYWLAQSAFSWDSGPPAQGWHHP